MEEEAADDLVAEKHTDYLLQFFPAVWDELVISLRQCCAVDVGQVEGDGVSVYDCSFFFR